MSTKLIDVNPFLRDPVVRRTLTIRSVASSSAIEGIHGVFEEEAGRKGPRKSAVGKGRIKRKKV